MTLFNRGMRRPVFTLTFALALGVIRTMAAAPAAPVVAARVPPGKSGAALDRIVSGLIARMTLDEKILQLLENPPNGVPRLGIPDLRWGEVLHGVVSDGATAFPQAIAMGSTWDPALLREMGDAVAREARALGVHQGYAPMLGLARDPRWGRVEESYGEDPYLVTQLGVAYIEGLQGTGATRLDVNHILATPKHFVADGEPWAGANGEDFETSERTLREVYFPPFEAAVMVAHAESLMPAHHAINGVPSHASAWLLRDVLRKEWGFEGFTVSDMGDIPKLYDGHGYARSFSDAAARALNAGVDQELEGGPVSEHVYAKYFGKALKDGTVSIGAINAAASRVLHAKIRLLGLAKPFESPSMDSAEDAALKHRGYDDVFAQMVAEGKETTRIDGRQPGYEAILNDPAHDKLALRVAQEALVLLKNQDGILPLDKTKTKHVLVVGPLGEAVNLGGYSTGKPKFYVNAVAGIQAELGADASVTFLPGCTLTGGTQEQMQAAVAAARNADVVVAVVGHTRAQLGENHDRDSLELPGRQEELVEALQATGKPLVVVLNNGAPFALPWIHEHVPAVIESWYLGQSYGTALAQVLFGDVNPSGKLNVSFPVSLGQSPSYYNHPVLTGPILYDPAKQDFPYPFGNSNVLWPFGHGLSYTTFRYDKVTTSASSIKKGEVSYVEVSITNTGTRSGDEVVQMYVHQDYTSLKEPVEMLKGFARVTVRPGESRTVRFPIGFEQVKFWKEGHWQMEAGKLNIMIGSSAQDIRLRQTLLLR
ncbi:beta-glucosidase [Granulicella pectinivorans]|uniref:Beta-glucosidase n=1 Tax=Granulicella pectinivorans TaxID=474950 RepID=A0A1I6MXH6_9BACT|nr:beta-glucosidase [Granulicella pectinivorans]